MLFLTGVVLSFLGWLWETIFSFFLRSPNDRGFLLLPICPIYGFALILVYLLFGTPADMRLLGHPVLRSKPVLRYLSYFLAAALLSTAIELVTATFFQSMFGIKLWSYAFLTDSFSEFISLLPSLFWGIAITVFMRFLFHPPLSCDRQNKAETSKRTFLGAACSCDSRCHIQFRLSVRKRPALRYSSLRQNHYRITAASGMIKKGRLPVPFYSSYTSFSITSMIHALSSETESADCTTRHPAFK